MFISIKALIYLFFFFFFYTLQLIFESELNKNVDRWGDIRTTKSYDFIKKATQSNKKNYILFFRYVCVLYNLCVGCMSVNKNE